MIFEEPINFNQPTTNHQVGGVYISSCFLPAFPPLFEAKANDVTLLHLDSLELAQLQRRLEHLGGWRLDQWSLLVGFLWRFFREPREPEVYQSALVGLFDTFTMFYYDILWSLWSTMIYRWNSKLKIHSLCCRMFLKGTVMPWFLGRNIVCMCSFLAFASAIDLCPCFLIIVTSLSRDIQMGQLGLSMNLGKNLAKTHETPETSSLKGLSEKHPLLWNSKTLPRLFCCQASLCHTHLLNRAVGLSTSFAIVRSCDEAGFCFFLLGITLR